MVAFDHVIITTPDVDATARRLLDEHGLAAIPGGRHPGHGTANRIVPLGDDPDAFGGSYVELMYVADLEEARQSPLGGAVISRTQAGESVSAVVLQVDDLEAVEQRLGVEGLDMSRTRQDGVELTWRLTNLDGMFGSTPAPGFIRWSMPAEHHPGRGDAPHPTEPRGHAWLEVGGDPGPWREWADAGLDLRFVEGPPGPRRVGIATAEGEVAL